MRHPVLRPLLAVSSLFLLANGALTVLVVPYVAAVLHGGDVRHDEDTRLATGGA